MMQKGPAIRLVAGPFFICRAWMRRLGLFEPSEWEQFSPETREIVLFFSGETTLQTNA